MKVSLVLTLLALSALYTADCRVVNKKHHTDDHTEDEDDDDHDVIDSVIDSLENEDKTAARTAAKRDRNDDNTRSKDDDDDTLDSLDRSDEHNVKSVQRKDHRDDEVHHATSSEEFEIVKSQCESALASSCDLDELVQLAAQLERFEDNPTSAEARDIVAQHGGLAEFCRKATTLFKCILDVADGSECRYYREYSDIDEHISEIRTGYNQIKENCPGNVKNVRLIVKKFIKQFK